MKVPAWDDARCKTELATRLKHARKKRERWESQWKINERTVFYWNSRDPGVVQLTEDNMLRLEAEDTGAAEQTDMAVNYAWKFLRFIHSQMSSNPPSVIARPTTTDTEDRQKADGADRVVRWDYQQNDIQEIFDDHNLKTLTYGSGYVRTFFDLTAGEALDFDDKTQEITLTGETRSYAPSTWDIWIDPVAKRWSDVRYYFERCEWTLEEAIFRWPDKEDVLRKFVTTRRPDDTQLRSTNDESQEEIVEAFNYIEKALPINGMAGRMGVCLEDGTPLTSCTANKNPGQTLGLAMTTDIDLPDEVYGVSFIQYVYRLQDLLNRLDTSFVDNVAAHNVVRMVLPEGADIEEDSLSNSAWDFVKITGNSGTGPYFVPAAALMPDSHKLRENLISGIQELAGVNDSMQGVQKREMSGFSMQTAIDAGNTVRRRLFNKYTLSVRNVFRDRLANAREFWTTPRTILVMGKEHAFEAADFKGADICGGYDITCEYGASLSLDPARRREEIMQLLPVFEKAGVPTKTVLSMLKLNELDTMYDRMNMAAERQREIFDEIISTRAQVQPRDLQDHQGMLDYCYTYVMTSTYKYLDPELQQLIDTHIKTREQMAKQAAVNGQANPATAATAAAGGAPEQQNNPQSAIAGAGGVAIPTGLPAAVLAGGNAGPVAG